MRFDSGVSVSSHLTILTTYAHSEQWSIYLSILPRIFFAITVPHGLIEEGIDPTTPEEKLERMLSGYHAMVLAGGHTHTQMVCCYGDNTSFNPGSVGDPIPLTGQNPNPAWAEYGVIGWEKSSLRMELRPVPVDVDLLVKTTYDSGIPQAVWWLTSRYGDSLK